MRALPATLARYRTLVQSFLVDRSEAPLQETYELGRGALADGLGILDLVAIHEVILDELQGTVSSAENLATRRTLRELLAPFELAFRGFREATGRLRDSAQELERRVAERTAELNEAERRLRSLVEQIPGVTYRAAPSGPRLLLYVSPQIQKLLGEAPERLLHRSGAWEEHLHPEDREGVEAAWLETAKRRADFVAQYRLRGPGGRTVWVEDHAALIAGEAGSVRQGILVDTTERRELEEQVRQSQKMETVGRLAGGVAHDFNNLLTVILTYSTLHRRSLPEGHLLLGDMGEIEVAAKRGMALTRQLLAFSRRNPVEPRTIDLNASLQESEKLLGRLVGEQFHLESSYEADLGNVLIDPGQLEQVVMNLVVNARDAMPDGGTVRMATRRTSPPPGFPPGEWAELAVIDQGVGMTEEVRARAFEPFFTTKPSGKGTGLGLATCFGIVGQAGGVIELTSAPGKGTTARVLLPLVGGAPLPSLDGVERSPRGHGETVLLVEDDSQLRGVTAHLIQSLGYDVLQAADGKDALQLFEGRARDVRLLLTDLNLPGMNGRALAARLHERQADLKIVFVSGDEDPVMGDGEIKGLGVPLIRKPYSIDELAQRLDEALTEGVRHGD